MKNLAMLLIAANDLLPGRVAYEIPDRDRGVYRSDRDRDGVPDQVDRDGDGVPNHQDRRPDNPRRY